jgi:hypothetical protein
MKNENRIFIHDRASIINAKYLIKRLLILLLDIIYITVIKITTKERSSKHKTEKDSFFSICAIFKDEEKFLKEWIEYHLSVGVDHFYLYNNLSTDNYLSILKPYMDKGIVDLIDWQVPPPSQFSAYEDCFVKNREKTKWITFIDIDEYICPFYDLTVKEWVSKYEIYPSVLIYWKMFGTSGLMEHNENKLITEQYTLCWDKPIDIGKIIFNTNYDVADFTNHHLMSAKVNFLGREIIIPPINEFKKFIKYDIHRVGCKKLNDFTIQLNHYWSKSYLSYINNKILRGDVNNHIRNLDLFFMNEYKNKNIDYKIWRFIIELKIRMGKINGNETKLE